MGNRYENFVRPARCGNTNAYTEKTRSCILPKRCARKIWWRIASSHVLRWKSWNPGAPSLDHWAPLELSARHVYSSQCLGGDIGPHALATFNSETIKPLWPFALTRPSVLGSWAAAKKRQLTGQVSGDSTFDIYGRWNLHHEWNGEFTSGMQHYATCLFYPNKQSSSQALLAVVCCG